MENVRHSDHELFDPFDLGGQPTEQVYSWEDVNKKNAKKKHDREAVARRGGGGSGGRGHGRALGNGRGAGKENEVVESEEKDLLQRKKEQTLNQIMETRVKSPQCQLLRKSLEQ